MAPERFFRPSGAVHFGLHLARRVQLIEVRSPAPERGSEMKNARFLKSRISRAWAVERSQMREVLWLSLWSSLVLILSVLSLIP